MERLFLVGPRRFAPTVLLSLQQAGVLQVDSFPRGEIGPYRPDPEEEGRLKRWEAVALSADHASGLLGLEFEGRVEPFRGSLEEAEAAASSFERQAALLMERRERLRDELQLIGQYRDVAERLAAAVQGLDRSRRLSVIPFLVEGRDDLAAAERELHSKLGERFLLVEVPARGLIAALVVTLKREAEAARAILAHEGWRELPRPAAFARMDLGAMAARLAERSRLAPAELAAVEEDLRRLGREAAGGLQGIWCQARDETERLHTLKAMASSRYGFALFGWVPLSRKERVMEVLGRLGGRVLYIFEPAEGHPRPEQVPVMLENPGWVRPFEPLITFLNTPRYDSWDPTWITAALFPLWFGMIVGDMGYGLAFAAIAWKLSRIAKQGRTLRIDFFRVRLAPGAVAQLVRVMKPMVAWTILWGFLHGEVFGNLFQKAGVFASGAHPGLCPTFIPRAETDATATTLILISIAFGILQVLHGLILKARLSRRQGDRRHFWEGTGYVGGVAALVLLAWAFMTGSHPWWLLVPMMAGAALFVAGMLGARMPLMAAELPTQGGHILSYIRIYALGLASAILANLATDIGFGLFRMWGGAGLAAGAVVGLLAGLLIHALLVVVLIISHVLQPIRLIWVEFFTKFDFYSFRGRPYQPFRLQGGGP